MIVRKNEILRGGDQGLSYYELTTDFRSIQISYRYMFKDEVLRKTIYMGYAKILESEGPGLKPREYFSVAYGYYL